jgi:uncharacterized cupredoxin-like copper-binding protein
MSRPTRSARSALLATVVAIVALLPACGGSETSDADVQITLRDFAVELSTASASAGRLTFASENEGPSVHEFEIFSVPDGVDANALPVQDGVADTEGLTVIDEVEDIAPGTTAELTVDLDPGGYAIICNLASHYEQGMHAAFTVE